MCRWCQRCQGLFIDSRYFHVNHLLFSLPNERQSFIITYSDFTYRISFHHNIFGGFQEKSKVCEEYDLQIYDADWNTNKSHPDYTVWLHCMTALQVYGC